MGFPTRITFHGVPHSDAIDEYIHKRAEKLDTLESRIVSCRVAVEHPHRHALHGEQYHIRIDIVVPGAEIVVNRVPDADRAYADLYAAVDAAFDDARRRLYDFIRRRREGVKRPERSGE